MALGQRGADEHFGVTFREAIPGVYDPTATPLMAVDIRSDGGVDEGETFSEHETDGIDALVGAAITGKEATLSGNYMPHYVATEERIASICGDPYSTTTLVDGRIQRKYKMLERGRPNMKPFTMFHGQDDAAYRLLYGKIQSLSCEGSVGGELGGSITAHFNEYARNVVFPGALAQNEIVRFVALNAATDGVFTFPATPLGAGGSVTLTPGITAAAAQTAIRALPGYNDVGVVVVGSGITVDDGTYDVTFGGALAGVNIGTIVKVSGAAWTVAATQQGTTGDGFDLPAGSYIESHHVLHYVANDFVDLATINMGNATTPAPLTDPHLIASVMSHSWSLEDLFNPIRFEDRKLFASSHVKGEVNVTDSITVAKAETGFSEDFYQTENADGCSVIAKYLRHAYRCGQREMWVDIYGGRNAAPDSPTENNLEQRQFGRRRFYNKNGSVIFTFISPAA